MPSDAPKVAMGEDYCGSSTVARTDLGS